MFSSSLHLDAQVLVIHTWEVHEDMHVMFISGIPMNVPCMQLERILYSSVLFQVASIILLYNIYIIYIMVVVIL